MKIKKELRDFYLKTRKVVERGEIDSFPFYFFIFFSLLALGLFLIFPDYLVFSRKKTEGIYREGIFEEVKILTPYLTTNDSEKTISNIIFPSLFENYNGKLISKYVKDYVINKEKNEIQITLQDNLFWANGEKFSPEDIRFGLEFAKKFAPPEIAKIFSQVDFRIINETQGTFVFSSPNNYFFYSLTYLKPLPVKIFSHYAPDFSNLELAKYGFGPFILKEIREEDQKIIILERNNRFPQRVYLKEIRFYIFKDQREALEALFAKEIDGLAGINYLALPPGFYRRITIYKIILPRVIGIFFNQEKIKTGDWVNYLSSKIDRSEIVKNIFNNYAEKSEGIFSPSIRKFLNLQEIKLSTPENLNQPIPDFNLSLPNSFFYPDLARYLKEKFKINFKIVSADELNEIIKTKNYEALLYGLNYGFPPNLAYFFSQAGINLNNKENKILEKEFFELKTNPQKDIFNSQGEVEKIILETKNNIFLVNPYYLYFLDKSFGGFDVYFLTDLSERFVKIQNIYKK